MDQNNEPRKMEFETDNWPAVKYYRETTAPKMIQLVIRYSGGLIKEQKHAEYILLGFALLAVIISIFLLFSGGNTGTAVPPNLTIPQY